MAKRSTSSITTIGQVYLIISLFVALIVILILLIQIQNNALMAVRAYISAEGLWAKAQKDATRSLEHYALSRNEDDYQSYLRFVQVTLGDSASRIEMQKTTPDVLIAQEGFLKGGNSPEDIECMINFFLRFQHTSFMAEAIEHWTLADQFIGELSVEAENLHQEISSGVNKPGDLDALHLRLDAINRQLTEQENQFSATLASASRIASKFSRYLTYGLAILFTLLGIGISWPITVRIRAAENTLLKNEEDLLISATAFESQESVMITDANSIILRVNRAFINETGYTAEEVVGRTPQLLKSGRHTEEFFLAMWETILLTGKWEGEIFNRRKNGEIYPIWLTISAVTRNDGVVTHYVGSHIDITERKVAENEIRNLAFYDPLTHLPNRRLLQDRLQQALAAISRSNLTGGVLFIDLDDFKTLNDTLGHDIGDQLLQQVAIRLESCVRECDTVARLGGDEFVIMLLDLSEHPPEAAAQVKSVGNKILATLNQPYHLAGREYLNTPSIGATLFSDCLQTIDELMKQADIAMYQAKKAGRNGLCFFDPQMQSNINVRVSLESELRKAIEQQQFQLHYQIQVDNLRRPFGAEALIRWKHPELGLIAPTKFISLAEETGQIIAIGEWVLETACAQLKAWEEDPLTNKLVLAVNVSPKAFRQPDFAAQVHTAVQRHGINPALLKLELTESMLFEDIGETIATMNTLNEMGVQFSLDDFGTGYSSLQYLKRLPIDQLKIDQSFVHDIAVDSSDRAIVSTIIAMAYSLNLNVIAEGVETEEQWKFLEKTGCTHYQGYLFGKPMPIKQFEAMLANNSKGSNVTDLNC